MGQHKHDYWDIRSLQSSKVKQIILIITYIPYAKSNRLCIGMNLSYLNLKIMAIVIATQKYMIDSEYKPYSKINYLKNRSNKS